MKAAVIKSPYNIEIVEIKKPTIKEDEVLAKVIYSGFCGTDLDIYKDNANFKVEYPIICGHEWSGVIEEIGSNVNYLKVGDRVVGNSEVNCGKCSDCLAGNYSSCINLWGVGVIGPWAGAFCEYIKMPERFVYKIPNGVYMLDAAITEPAVISAYSVDMVGINPGDIVLITGTGAIGLFSVQYSRLKGAGLVILAGRNDKKLKIAKELGADFVINTRNENMFKKLKEITEGKEVNVSIEASGNIEALKDLLKITGRFGRISIPGSYPEKIETKLGQLAENNLTLRFIGTTGGGNNFNRVLWLMKLNKINARKLITEIYELEDINAAIKKKLSPSDSIKTVVRVDKEFME